MSSYQYQNPQPSEGINYTDEHPLKELFQLLLGITVIVVVAVLVISLASEYFAKKIPPAYERKMVQGIEYLDLNESNKQQYLQQLADEITPLMDLPEGLKITVHYSEDDVVNAFATIGGHVFFYQGLLDEMESEDELVAVMAHEIAHQKYRHPIVAFGKGVTVAALIASVSGASGSDAGSWLLGNSSNMMLLKFSRDQEQQSDLEAAEVLAKRYGHVKGLQQLFKRFDKMEQESGLKNFSVEILNSHPYSENRWQTIKRTVNKKLIATTGELTPLNLPN